MARAKSPSRGGHTTLIQCFLTDSTHQNTESRTHTHTHTVLTIQHSVREQRQRPDDGLHSTHSLAISSSTPLHVLHLCTFIFSHSLFDSFIVVPYVQRSSISKKYEFRQLTSMLEITSTSLTGLTWMLLYHTAVESSSGGNITQGVWRHWCSATISSGTTPHTSGGKTRETRHRSITVTLFHHTLSQCVVKEPAIDSSRTGQHQWLHLTIRETIIVSTK